MESEIVVSNLKEFEKKKKIFRDKDKYHVISDFDRTLTYGYLNGKTNWKKRTSNTYI